MSLCGNSDAYEAKPKWLTGADKKLTYATASGWVYKKSGWEIRCSPAWSYKKFTSDRMFFLIL